ncbi:MAG: hypothetical protein WCJ09_19070 [Planctomycetota bacterium]
MRNLILSCVILSLVSMSPLALQADDAGARAIIESAIERNGGEKRLAKVKGTASKIKGSVNVNGIPIPFTGEIASHGGTRQRISVSLSIDGQAIAFVSVVNQGEGWRKIVDNTVEMTADELTEAKASAYSVYVQTLIPLRDKAFELTSFGEREVAGRKVGGVTVSHEGRRPINLFFDKETYRLLRSEVTVRDEATFKEVQEESTMSDFKEFDGVPRATKITVKRNGQLHAEIEVEDFKTSETVDEALFAKP